MNRTPFSKKRPTVTILGCGYVGVTTASVLANCGYNVYAVEPMADRLSILQQGRSFFYEAGVDPLIENALTMRSLKFTDSYETSIPNSTMVFSCVGTPDNADGSSNLTYVFAAAIQAGKLMKPGTIFVQKSTVPVGTSTRVKKIFAEGKSKIYYVANPEFLAESSAIKNTLWFDRIVAGSDDSRSARKVLDIYKDIEQNAAKVAKIALAAAPPQPARPQYIRTTCNSAELIKVSANAFLALKISFANSIAKLADKSGADIDEVMAGVGADQRIGRAFFNAGRGYGGGCFPKDVSGLVRTAAEYGVDMEIIDAMTNVNESMPHYIINNAREFVSGTSIDKTFKAKKVAVLGLAFKAGTSDSRHSPAVAITNTLAEQGAKVSAYDPAAMEESRSVLHENVCLCQSLDAAITGANYIFIATDWPEFKKLTPKQLTSVKLLVDCMNCFDKTKLPKFVKYIGVGKN